MMDPVSNLNQIIETLRRQVSTRLDKKEETAAQPRKAENAPAQASGRASLRDLQPMLVQRIRAISPDDKRRQQKATRIFLETALVNEFGDAFLADPKFAEIVEEVQATMEANEEISRQLDVLLAQLTR